jgi:hypothetical protein
LDGWWRTGFDIAEREGELEPDWEIAVGEAAWRSFGEDFPLFEKIELSCHGPTVVEALQMATAAA